MNILLSTVPSTLDWGAYVEFLDADGTFSIVGVPEEPLNLSLFSLLAKRRRIMSSPIGGRAMIMEMLSVAEEFGIEPVVEVFPIEKTNEAIEKVRDNEVRYRAVLTVINN